MNRTQIARFFVALALVLAVVQAGVQALGRTDPLGGTGGGPISGTLQVRVVHEGTTDPIPGAFVMAGPSPGSPFPDNWGLTSAAGEITFSDPALQGPVSVTAGASGLAYFTLVSVDASELVIPLKPVISAASVYEVGDYVSGIDVNNGSFNFGDGNVDLAFVLQTLRLEDVMSFDLESLLGPIETIDILGEPFEVPSNFFIPQQWEVFIEIIKDHYYLYLPAGDYTFSAMSGRIPVEDLLAGGDMAALLTAIDWREIDILDVTVDGNTYTADLHVDPDLAETVTLNLANIPDGSSTWCISAGDLDNRAGLGRLVPLGLTSFDCPGGSGPCAGTVHLTTTAATGEFTGMTYFPVVAVDLDASEDMLVIMDREPRPRTYAASMESFFSVLDLTYADGLFSWNDVENPGSGSPDVHAQIARIRDTQSEAVYWEFMIPGSELSVSPPLLPPEAPPGLSDGAPYNWEFMAFGLAYELPSFDFNSFAFSDVAAHGSHLALDNAGITFVDAASGIPGLKGVPALTLLGNRPNPFRTGTTFQIDLPQAAEVDLSIYAVDGRKLATVASGLLCAGRHNVIWNSRDDLGQHLPGGAYWAKLQTGGFADGQKIVLLK